MAEPLSKRPRAKSRRPLSRERIVAAGLKLADEEGLEALSMRRLAKELRVEAMSLYNHVANKDDLLDAMLEAVVGEIELPPGDGDWRDAVRRSTISARDAYVRHRWASGLSLSRQTPGPVRLRHSDWILRTLREAGFSPRLVHHAFHILDAYLLGFTRLHLSVPAKPEELAQLAASFLPQLSADEYPDLVQHIHEHVEPRDEHKGGFELGLDLILDGFERLRASEG